MIACLGTVVKKKGLTVAGTEGVKWSAAQEVYPWLPKCIVLKSVKFVYPGVNRPVREVDHSHSYSAEVKNEWGYTSAPPVCLHGVDREHYPLLYFTVSFVYFLWLMYTFLYILHIGAAWRHRSSGATGGIFPLIMRPGLEMLGM
jgi:hypothetical protein